MPVSYPSTRPGLRWGPVFLPLILALSVAAAPGAGSLRAQENGAGPEAADTQPTAGEAGQGGGNDEASPSRPTQGRGLVVPDLDVYFPDGDFDLRLHRLIDKVFFEGQIKYDFVDGDISAFLRYRYYGYQRTYQLSAFDTIEFEGVEELSDEFERVRGVLFLTQWPHTFHRRTFLAAELDGISSNKEASDNGKVNTFLRLGYQLGTPDDSRSNAIVGETRAKVERLFTPYRAIGPGDAGFTGALTWGFSFLGGDFDYLRLELEALKRFELPGETFLIGRIHNGTFLTRDEVTPEGDDPGAILDADPTRGYSIPRNELFRLDGRDNLKTLDLEPRQRGTEELHTTWEFLVPWFTQAERPFLRARWETWYWVAYLGYGTLGTERDIYTDFSTYILDAGVGFQSSFKVRDYTLFLSAIVGQAFEEGAEPKLRVSFKSYH